MAVDREKVLQAAQKLVEKKRYDKAIAEYQKLVAEDPNDARTLLKIGDLYLKLEQYAEAIQTYERVGQFYSLQGFALKAIAVYKQIREIVNKHVPHLEDRFGHIGPRLAEIYTQLGLTSDALAAYDEVATRFQRSGRDRDAIDIFKKVVDLDPKNPLPYLRLAEAFVRIKDVDNAIQRFGSAAEILVKLGRRDDALKVVERLLQYRAEAAFARMAAEIYLDRGGPNDGMAALTKLQICFKENPKDLETLALLARAFERLNQPAKAIEVQKEAARIAKEGGKLDAFNALVDQLLLRAPNDEVVRQLAAQRGPPGPGPSMASIVPTSRGSIEVELDDAEEVLVDDSQSEAPFALRPSYHSVSAPAPVPVGTPHAPRSPSVPPAPIDPGARTRQLLARAEVYRRGKQYDPAIQTLREGILELPAARELREKICDLLIEAGDQDGAVVQMLQFARALSAEGDIEAAARVLDEVLLLEPDQADAITLLRALGYALPSETYEAADDAVAVDEYGAPYAPPAQQPQPAGQYDPEEPLPSYDLDEVGAATVLARQTPVPRSVPVPRSGHIPPALTTGQLDDPFSSDEPLPSFPIDDDAPQFVPPSRQPPNVHTRATRDVPVIEEPSPIAREPAPPPPPPPRAASELPPRSSPTVIGGYRPQSEPPAQLDEDALEEMEFFTSHSMFDEARALLDEQLSRLPNHPILLERMRELEALAAGGGAAAEPQQSGARELPRSSQPVIEDAADRSFDIAASLDALDALDALEEGAPKARAQLQSSAQEQVSVETVFEQFKAGVAAQISESDASTHYDLGVAYREMGLLTDAIAEFDLASRDPLRDCVCQSMIGMIQLDLGNIPAAIDSFIRGLHASHMTSDQELALNYEIANAYEMRNSPDQALFYFQRVARIDPGYTDPRGSAQDRIARLEPVPKAPPARAVGAELVSDEFDAAFDELLSRGGKLP